MSILKTVKIAAPAGLGVKSGGQLLARILIASGFNIKDYNEYPSLVRGGHNTYQVSFSDQSIFAPHYHVDLFFSLLGGHWQAHQSEFSKDTLVFGDEEYSVNDQGATFLNLPLKQLSEESGSSQTINTICLGVTAYLYGLNPKIAKDLISTQYAKFVDVNLKAFDLGFDFAQNNFTRFKQKFSLPVGKNKCPALCDGNESIGWGFIKSGGNFYAAYPMTPATGILHFLAEKQKEFKITVLHPEDEIAVANIAAGASFAGARAAVGTSGGGFVLMDETISFCGVAEIGMVFYLVSRPGPATGLPTWTGQGELLHAIYAGHGEFPKVVLAPGSQAEAFELAAEAQNLTAILQTPVIVLSDKYLGESSSNVSDFSKIKVKIDHGEIVTSPKAEYRRYSLKTQNGISPVTFPGTLGGEFLSNSYEHDEYGFATEDGELAKKMTSKRMQKQFTAQKLTPKNLLFGSKTAKKLIISWGSTTAPVLEALKDLPDYAFLQVRTLWPIDPNLSKIINKHKNITVIENNQTGQLTTLLKSQFDFHPDRQILKFDGRPFYPEELIKLLTL
jgi:2-oxoglutarate/2-oxoacid ferredoxin oxidoreductase subunit alpha